MWFYGNLDGLLKLRWKVLSLGQPHDCFLLLEKPSPISGLFHHSLSTLYPLALIIVSIL